ncbi:hypothetical protein CC79DRAFT_1179004 [Sarocladium strictum]|jgi:hypothetical protein
MAAEFALAANIIAAIGFTIQIWTESSEIRKRGSTITAEHCSRDASSLQRYCQTIRALQVADHDPDLEEAVRLPSQALAEQGESPFHIISDYEQALTLTRKGSER